MRLYKVMKLITAQSYIAPENTLIAIQKAIKLGFKLIEIDMQLCRDGVPIMFHGFSVNRCKNG